MIFPSPSMGTKGLQGLLSAGLVLPITAATAGQPFSLPRLDPEPRDCTVQVYKSGSETWNKTSSKSSSVGIPWALLNILTSSGTVIPRCSLVFKTIKSSRLRWYLLLSTHKVNRKRDLYTCISSSKEIPGNSLGNSTLSLHRNKKGQKGQKVQSSTGL